MDTIENIAMLLAPEDEIERIRIKMRVSEIMTEIRIYRKQYPDTKLTSEQIFRRVRRQVAWRIVKRYLFSPLRRLRLTMGMFGLL